MKLLEFKITQPNGKTETVEVALQTVRIGSGAHCEIRLPTHLRAKEYVRVELGERQARLESLAFDPQPLLDGTPFTRAVVDEAGELSIDDVTIAFRLVDDDVVAKKGKSKQQGLSPASIAMAILCLPLAAYVLSPRDAPRGVSVPAADAPLWPDEPPSCPEKDEGRALAFAEREVMAGSAKRERAPFFPGDGVEAATHFQRASSCLEAAKRGAESEILKQRATELVEQLTLDFRAHRVRMEYAIDERDWPAVAHEVALLRSYTKNAPGAFSTWLANAERRLAVEGRL